MTLADALALHWGGERNLAVREALRLPRMSEEPSPPAHKCWVDQAGVVTYIGPDAERVRGELAAAGLEKGHLEGDRAVAW